MSRAEELARYAELSDWIKELSSPSTEDIDSAEAYNERIITNYNRMRELNGKSTSILSEYVYPLLGESEDAPADAAKEEEQSLCALTTEEWEDLFFFCERLYDAENRESVDDNLRYRVAKRLLQDAEEKADEAKTIRALGLMAECCACMVMVTVKLYPESDAVVSFRKEGLSAAKRLRAYLEKDAFTALTDQDLREIVLKSARELWTLFVFCKEPRGREENEEHLRLLKDALALSADSFYIDQAAKYNWKNHRYRILQGITSLTEYHNAAGMDEAQLREISAFSRQLLALWKEDRVLQGALSSSAVLHLNLYRNAHLAGELSLAEYRKELLQLMDEADDEDYTYDGNMRLVMTLSEYLLTFDRDGLTAEDEARIFGLFDRLIRYVSGMPKLGSITALIVFLTFALEAFSALGLSMGMAELCMKLLAAINPPTFRHCLTASRLASCITGHLFDREPSLFTEIAGYPEKDRIVSFMEEAALLHDCGKIWIAEAVTNYARGYFHDETEMLMIYPDVGASFLSRFPDTAAYAEIMRHHREERWDHDIATQIVSYADYMSRRPKDKEDDVRANIPFIGALCREEPVKTELQQIVADESEVCAREIFRILSEA